MDRPDLYDMTREELAAWLIERGQPRFRADQLFHWAHALLARGFQEMTNLPAALREELAATLRFGPAAPLEAREAEDSTKLLLELSDGQTVECVRMVTGPDTASACVSSQVGCAIGCAFCASGAEGLIRNLSAGEIVLQAVTLRALVGPARNLVFMGMGEPLHNVDALLKALTILLDREGWGLSAQRVTVATSGGARGIRRLVAEGPPVELALSLNAPTDALRRELMPGVRDALVDVLAACDEFSARHGGRPVTFAYVLLRGVNDQPEHAQELAQLLGRRRHHLNLIAYNAVEGLPFERPAPREMEAFAARLERARLNVSLRRSRGQSINAACGQLRAARGPER
ncbi:MAG: 23S rRNA (adenine(2503)-C(2))-methyltransferase RlmN [Armatimonadetes bacterium]|nr:23S rRNA (adenine(2503)-C(2))-methyltransferase RlmN [Armatimonadota bacterium]